MSRSTAPVSLDDFLDPSSFWVPELVVASGWLEHAPFAFWLLDADAPGSVVELGTHAGYSFFAMCQAVVAHRLETRCYAIDTWTGDEHAGFYSEGVFDDVQARTNALYGSFARLIRSTFDEALHQFDDGTIDLLHIDGRHFYEDVAHDFEAWLPKMSESGLVLLHDTNVLDRGFGVHRLFEELSLRWNTFEFRHGNGLGVIATGEKIKPRVSRLLSLDEAGVMAAREAYARLGKAIAVEWATGEGATRAQEDAAARHQLETALAGELQIKSGLNEAINALRSELRITRAALDYLSPPWWRRLERSIGRRLTGAFRTLPWGWTNPLIDADWYLSTYPDVSRVGMSPQRHYRRHGVRERRNPSPLFDTSWYLAQYPDVAYSGMNPLDHYLRFGAQEGRDPHAAFDTDWYLSRNPDVRISSVNPLLHYLRHGRSEGRLANPGGAAMQPRLPEELGTTVRHAGGSAGASSYIVRRLVAGDAATVSDPSLVCLSHVPEWPPRAGNVVRLHRLLERMRHNGWQALTLYCPPVGARRDDDELRELLRLHPNTVVVERDGSILHALTPSPLADLIDGLDGRRINRSEIEKQLGEGPGDDEMTSLIREFCPDALVGVLLELMAHTRPRAVLANYVFMTRPFPALPKATLRIIDTVDVFSTKQAKVLAWGVMDPLALTPAQEGALLDRTDIAIAIQPDEADALRQLTSRAKVITAGVDYDVAMYPGEGRAPICLLVASDNPLNQKGVNDFLDLAWPKVAREVPGAQVRIVGGVARHVAGLRPGVVIVGHVPDIATEYAAARVAINPAVAGTGLKIKTVEALAFVRPVVTWAAGVDGLPSELRDLCDVVSTWTEFGEKIVDAIRLPLTAADQKRRRAAAERCLSAEAVYAELDAALPGPPR